ncbi:MAG: flagellar biosynthesis anti-sigma factor FlgM [Syntrophales bacterium]|jgi:negative regulator of flagellin synthesis FlgM|nr:flagellar biosynthesis anti-sigma factor FlgM [Syntrophales bacterium]MDY0043346.1 flagellar biosynthesis anti-sigma factor FlgM [Syntrophales bacterium]
MKVSETRNQASELVSHYKINEKTATGRETQVSGKTDPEEKVSLSAKAKDINKVKEAIAELPDMREEKVMELKRRIDEGSYRVEGEKVADKLIEESLLDIFA